MGFDQSENARNYRFDGVQKGEPIRHFVVTADLSLFLTNRVRIQEGPTLCADKLAADLEKGNDDAHELTADDLRTHADALAAAEARKAEARTSRARQSASNLGQANSPWRDSGS
jgi:hypothetical protein